MKVRRCNDMFRPDPTRLRKTTPGMSYWTMSERELGKLVGRRVLGWAVVFATTIVLGRLAG